MTEGLMGAGTLSRLFDNREGLYHLVDAAGRPLIRQETGRRVFGTLVDYRAKLMLLDDPVELGASVLKAAFPVREWISRDEEPKACDCSDALCQGKLVVRLAVPNPDPQWTLVFCDRKTGG